MKWIPLLPESQGPASRKDWRDDWKPGLDPDLPAPLVVGVAVHAEETSSSTSFCQLIAVLAALAVPAISLADNNPQFLPFQQNWSNPTQINGNDNWSGVPGFVGYRGDDLTTAIGTDPRTIVADGTTTPVNVIANQANPNSLATGGLAEFDGLSDPVVAFQGSATADAPFLLLNLNTLGWNTIVVSYALRDIDGSADNAVQPVAFQYRVGNSGNFINVASGYVADASTGPNQATFVNNVVVTLPASADNQPLIQVRWITANATGNDEWIGIDNIFVHGNSGPSNPSGTGAANPAAVMPGDTSLFTVTVTPGGNPPSTGLGVFVDLSAIGGSASQQFLDNGTQGDVTPGDNVFSFGTFVSTSPGNKSLPFTISDFQGRIGSGSIALSVIQQVPINFLHSLQDNVNWLPTDTTNLYRVEGVVTTRTNLTSAGNAQFYIQDPSGGIVVFVAGGSSLRPAAGDFVRVTGPLSHFNGLLELNLNTSNPAHSVVTLGSNTPLPLPVPFNFSESNNIPGMEFNREGRLVVVSNVFLDVTSPNFPSGATVRMTNSFGQLFALFIDSRVTDIVGQPKPSGLITAIIGVLGQNDATDPRDSGYQILPTRLADIVTSLSYNLQIFPGWNLIANQLDRGGNTLNEILPDVPDGSTLYKWNRESLSFQGFDQYDSGFGGWMDGQTFNPSTTRLDPGDAAFLNSPSFFVVTISGSPHVPVLPVTIPNGVYYYLSRQTNGPGTYDNIVGTPPSEGAQLYRYQAGSPQDPFNPATWNSFTFSGGVWTPQDPVVSVGEAVALYNPAVNNPPSISGIADQFINEDTTNGPLAFTINDPETPPDNLSVSGFSGNQAVVPLSAITFGGIGPNRTVTIRPALNQFGTAQITITVGDGVNSTSTSFQLTVNPVNDAPTVSAIADQVINENGTNGPIGLTVNDVESPPANLTLSATSTNTALVPSNNIVFTGNGPARTMTITPVQNQYGTTRITVTVSDGAATGSSSFLLTVNPLPPSIVTQPAPNQSLSCGGTFGLSVIATGHQPLTYQWRFNGLAINNATNSSFNKSSATPSDSGPYVVVVANSFGVRTSSVATVTVVDTVPPVITLPSPPVVECAGPAGTIVNFSATALDACAGAVSVNFSPASGSAFPLGQTVVTATAMDPSGNSASETFTVTVRDTTPPRPNVCPDPPVATEQGGRNAPAGGPASPRPDLLTSLQGQPTRAFDDATPGATFVHSWPSLPECVTEATLEIGLRASGPSSLDDTIALGFAQNGIFNPLWVGRLGQAGTSGALLTHVPWNSGAQEVISLDVARLPQADGSTLNLVPTMAANGFLDVSIANDTLVDFTKLVATSCRDRPDVVVNTTPGQAGAIVNYAYPTFTDVCDSSLVVSSPRPPGSFFPIGRTVVPVTAVDHSGNVGLSWFAVICQDHEPPVLNCQPVEVNCVCARSGGAPAYYQVRASDNSGHVTVQSFPPSGSVFPIGTTIVNAIATDPSGNTSQCTFPVTVRGAPVVQFVGMPSNNVFILNFDTQAGQHYVVEYRNNILSGPWNVLTEVIGNGGMVSVTDPVIAPARFYRVKQTAEPETNCTLATIYEPPEPPPGQPGPSDPCRPSLCGPPNVYLFSGEFHYAQVDLCIKGRGLDFVWGRKYRSCICYVTPMGRGWDWSYNIYIIPSGLDVMVLDGNTRKDTFYRQADGSFVADQFFREGRFQPDGRFVLTFADQGTWQFLPLGSGAAGGRIERITDRNGNALRFNYNLLGQLTNVVDTLDRNIDITYDGDGFFAAVTDFTGRQVRYTHYQDVEPGGSFSDLKSVVTPAVTGTPNGNDFPGGKTNTYTYSKGSADDKLNHNLLTVTDGKGQSWLQNTYAPQPACGCAQVVKQVWGYTNETLEYSYNVQAPAPANNFAIMKTIVNDRVGNVSEYYHDAGNRCVINREFTGRAVPGVTTTETQNRPTGKLRSTDPDFFETRREWNLDSMPVRVSHPNGNYTENVYELELNPAAPRRARGNLRICRKYPGPLGGDQAALVELFEYETGAGGGCCDFNFVTKQTDARGNITLHSYDARGNRLHTQHRVPTSIEDWDYNEFGQVMNHWWPDNGSGYRRRDASSYYGAGPQRGYLAQQIVDASGFTLTTTFEYDSVGNVVRAVDPRGHDTLYTVNARNQVVREASREVTPGSSMRYSRDFFYDANDNLVRTDVENRDELGVLQDNTHQSTILDYDILNRVVRVAQEKGGAHPLNGVRNYEAIPFALRPQFVVTENAYDANRNRTLVRFGEATADYDPFNIVSSSYDERDLLFHETRAPGSALQSTTRHDYDGNRNLTRVSQGIENTPRVTLSAYDGFNREVSVSDAMGNVKSSHYDANNNCVLVRLDGELTDLNGGAGNVRLAETWFQYDAMDRLSREDKLMFDPKTQAVIADGQASTLTFYSDNSQVVRVTDDRGYSTTTVYDTANRRQSVIDPKTNSVSYAYDANGNVIVTTETERSDLGNPLQSFNTTSEYDGLDRLAQTVQGGGTNRFAYDSQNNRVRQTDTSGHEIRHAYDGINRLVQTVRDMNTNGASAIDAADIVTSQEWDDSCRLIAQTDDNGHTTRYAYDALNRRIATRLADGTMELTGSGAVTWPDGEARPQINESFFNGYDVHGNVTRTTDARLTVVVTSFDLLNRPVSKSIARAPGVLGATFETRQFDGRSLLVQARNNDTLVNRAYDSLCNLLRETVNLDPPFPPAKDRVTIWSYDGVGNPISCTYPGGRLVTRSFDGLNRVARICNGACVEPPPSPPAAGSLVAQYYYVGPTRIESRCYGNGTCEQFAYNAARLTTGTTNRQISTGVVLDQRAYAWNAERNKTSETDARPGGPGLNHAYTYDAADRLTHAVVSSPINPAERDSLYTFDGVGNRLNVTSDPAPGNYTLDPASPAPADAQVNQYSATPFDAGRQYDANGNLISISSAAGAQSFQYDYRNLLMKATIGAATPTLYTYDALGRRVQKAGGANVARIFHDGSRELEEQDAAGNTLATYVSGRDGTELLNMRRGASDYYYHADDLGSVTALSDAAGNVAERYDYGDYGEPEFSAHVQSPNAVTALTSDVNGGQFVADDFSFSRAVRIGGVRWWGAYSSGVPAVDSFTIRIHANNAGVPGAVLSTTAAGNSVHRVATGRTITTPITASEFVYETPLSTVFDAQPGTIYWLEIVNNTTGSATAWGMSSAGNGNQYFASSANGVAWATGLYDTAFELLTDQSAVANPFLFTGRRYDSETVLYHDHTHQLDPLIGRFTTRDLAAGCNQQADLGNGFTFNGNNPVRTRATELPPVFLPKIGCGDYVAEYCPQLASLWGQPYFCWSKKCGTRCASYTCCQRPVRRCAPMLCGGGKVEQQPACPSVGNNCVSKSP